MRRFLCTSLFVMVFGFAAMSEEKEGGITGTGVVGQITALGSIYVNDLHIHFADDMTLDGVADSGALRPGMTVAAAVSQIDDRWTASTIRRISPLMGPVTGAGEVMGVAVLGVDVPEDGWVRVDGHWTENGVVGSLVEPVQAGLARMTGPYRDGQIGGIAITGIIPQHVVAGDIVHVEGTYGDGAFAATVLSKGLFVGEVPDLVLAEGFLSRPDPSGVYRLIGAGLTAYTDRPEMVNSDARVLRCAVNGAMDFDQDRLDDHAMMLIAEICPARSARATAD